MAARALLTFCLCLFLCSVKAQVFDIPHQSEDPTRTFLAAVQNPKALVLLYPGGAGMLHLKQGGSTKNRHTFVRSLDLWAQYQIDAVLVDTPYSLGDLKKGDLRNRQDHLGRVGEVVRFYKEKTGLPIWIFGHSMGSATATNFVNQLQPESKLLTGIIIAGTIRTVSLEDEVTMPVEAIHHAQDECLGTPISVPISIISSRPKNTISRMEVIDGGITEGNVCDAFAYHGFNQTEPELVKRAAQFILNQ